MQMILEWIQHFYQDFSSCFKKHEVFALFRYNIDDSPIFENLGYSEMQSL